VRPWTCRGLTRRLEQQKRANRRDGADEKCQQPKRRHWSRPPGAGEPTKGIARKPGRCWLIDPAPTQPQQKDGRAPAILILPVVFEDLDKADHAGVRRYLRSKYLSDLGWTIRGNVAYPPGEDPDAPIEVRTVAGAANDEGMPHEIEELYWWGRHRADERFWGDAAMPAHLADERWRQWKRAASSVNQSLSYAPVEEHITERASFSQDATEREAYRIESALVQQFARYLRQKGHEPSRVDITVDQEVIRADLYDRTTDVLYEAKASPDRRKLRMAIGQLLDYRRFVTPQPQLRVLVPEPPNQDLCRLLAAVGIGAAWPEREGWQEVEPDRLGSVAVS
jgi:hypothetical protein